MIAAVMAAINCSEKSKRGKMVCSKAENSESENASNEIGKKGFQ